MKKTVLLLSSFHFIFLMVAAQGIIPNSTDLIWADMHDANTGWVSNMPGSFGQFKGPTPKQMDIGNYNWDHVNIWIEIEEAGNGSSCSHGINKATNTRVEFGWTRGYALIDGQWVSGTESKTEIGAKHPHPGQGNWGKGRCNLVGVNYFFNIQLQHMDYVIDKIESETGFRSVKPKWYYRWHGWSSRYKVQNPRNVDALFGEIYMRLIVEDPTKPDDRDSAKYVAHISSDRYLGTCASDCYRGDFGISRYKLITRDWQPFNFSAGLIAFDKSALEANPPPFTTDPLVAVREPEKNTAAVLLVKNFGTEIDFNIFLPAGGGFYLDIYGIEGRKVWSRQAGSAGPGHYSLRWMISNTHKGVYIAVLRNFNKPLVKKLVIAN